MVVIGLGLAAATGGGQVDAPTVDPVEDGSGAEGAADADALLAQLERREEGDPLALGDVDAPVLMIEWSDFQCPFCGAFARDIKPELIERYVDPGVLRIEWRDLPLQGSESHTAALAGRAAGEQGAFWALHDAIYAEERDRNVGELAREALVAMAADLDLDTDRFEAALDDPAHAAAVRSDLAIGQSLGITGTPAFLLNGRPLMGAQPIEVFAGAIEALAAEADAP